MPLFFQQDFNGQARLGIWEIREPEDFFLERVPPKPDITHPHKRLQHLAGRWLLRELYDDFPYDLIRIADTRKPFLLNEAYHFSISHCGDYAAAIVSPHTRVGIDIERVSEAVGKIVPKFLDGEERLMLTETDTLKHATVCWSAKETVFKWYGYGQVDFRRHIRLRSFELKSEGSIACLFRKDFDYALEIQYKVMGELCLSYTF